MHVVVAKVHENLFAGEAESLSVPTTAGVLTILPKHEPLVANIQRGEVVVRAGGVEKKFAVEDGVLEVSGNQATVLL